MYSQIRAGNLQDQVGLLNQLGRRNLCNRTSQINLEQVLKEIVKGSYSMTSSQLLKEQSLRWNKLDSMRRKYKTE